MKLTNIHFRCLLAVLLLGRSFGWFTPSWQRFSGPISRENGVGYTSLCSGTQTPQMTTEAPKNSSPSQDTRREFTFKAAGFFGLSCAVASTVNPFESRAEFVILQGLQGKYDVTSRCYLDFSIDGTPADRVEIALFGNVVPKTVGNFEALIKREEEGYKGTEVYRVVEGFNVQMGAVGSRSGDKGASSFEGGESFDPENFVIPHNEAGVLSMVKSREGKNDSRFFISLDQDAGWADGKYVGFGLVTKGFDTIKKISELPTNKPKNNPKAKVIIESCGML